MISISRKVDESVLLLDEEDNVIATIKIQPQRRAGRVNLGLEFDTKLKVRRAETYNNPEYQITS